MVYKGTQFTEYEDVEQPKPDEPEEKKFDGSSLTGKVLGAVAAAGCVAAAFGLVAAWGASVAFSGGAAFAAAPLAWQGFAFLMAAAPIAMEAGNAISKQYNQDMANQKDSGWGTYAKISIVDPVVVGARDSAIGLVGGAAAAKLVGVGSKLMGKMFKPMSHGRILRFRPLTAAEKYTYRRPTSFRKGVRDEVWEAAKDSGGQVKDPLTISVMNKNQPWDMGHKPGHEFSKHQQSAAQRGITRQEFLDEWNDVTQYRPELPLSNQGHVLEDCTELYLGP